MYEYIIIDGNNIAFRSWKAMESDLLTFNGQDVSAIFGFLRTIKSILTEPSLTAEKVVIVWDYGRSSYRSSIYPSYKGNREHDDSFKEFIRQMNDIYNIMSMFPVAQLKMRKVEGDDLIGAICYLSPSSSKLIVSGDKDLAQFINDHTHLYKLGMYAKQHELVTPENFSSLYSKCRVPFNKIVDYKVVCGDKSDNIEGIKGIGDKSMDAIFERCGGIKEAIKMFEEGQIPKDDKRFYKNIQKLKDSTALIDLNTRLIDIRYALDKDIVMYAGEEMVKELYPDIEGIKNELSRLGFNSILRDLPRFLDVFHI